MAGQREGTWNNNVIATLAGFELVSKKPTNLTIELAWLVLSPTLTERLTDI